MHALLTHSALHHIIPQAMCKDCIARHLDLILQDTRRNLLKSNQLIMEIESAYLCDAKMRPAAKPRRYRRRFVYPGASLRATKKTTILVRLIGLISDNIKAGKVSTIRDIFYQDVELFRTQRMAVAAIDQLCRLLHVTRRALNIVPSPNGLIAADLTVVFEQGLVHEISRASAPSIIPVGSAIFHIIVRKTPKFILVVEKEAVFAHLHLELPEAILITGKGFPDLYTRQFLAALMQSCPLVPVYCLVDADVHGILIMKNYRNGPEHNLEPKKELPITFLGVSLKDYSHGFVNTTILDKRCAMSTLRKAWVHEPSFKSCRTELQRGLFMGKKAEMNVLDSESLSFLAKYVRRKIKALE